MPTRTADNIQIMDVKPSERKHFRLPVCRRSSGEDLAISVHVARGASDGPTLGLVAAVHGDAIYGTRIVKRAFETLDLSKLRGSVVAVPVANPVAFESATRTTGQGWNTDMNNMNRVFPGAPGGWVTQQMAAVLAEHVVPNVDALLDYHCGNDGSIDYTLVNGDSTPEQKRIFNYTRLMGTNFMYIHDVDPFSGTLDQYARSLGKLSIVAEQGGDTMPDGFETLSMTRVANFLKGLDMIDGTPEFPDRQLVMRGGRTIQRIEEGGLFYPEVGIEALSSIIPGDTLLATVVDPHSFETLQEIRAPYAASAIFQTKANFGRVNPGDYAYIIGDATTAVELPRPSEWRVAV